MQHYFQKLYTVEEEGDVANTICNSDGGALASVLTQDDKSALDYYGNQTAKSWVLVGLKKIEYITCSNQTCNWKLRWQNGKTFVFDSLIHDEVVADGSSNSNCFKRNFVKQWYNDMKCVTAKGQFVCQITCPGESKFIKIT